VTPPRQPRRVTTWMRQALPGLGLTVGLGLLATAGIESVNSIWYPWWAGRSALKIPDWSPADAVAL
jgi:hypothetical protein